MGSYAQLSVYGLPLLSVLLSVLWVVPVAVGGDEADGPLGMQVVVDVPAGIDLFQVFDPDLEPARGSKGIALLFAPEGAHADGEWLLVTCRSRGKGEKDFEAPLGGLGDEPIATFDGPEALIAVAEPAVAPPARVAIALPHDDDHIISVATSVEDYDLVQAATDALDSSFNETCDVVSELDVSEGWTLVVRRRTADAPAGYVGDSMLSMDRTAVFWRGAQSDQAIGLGSTALTPADDDLVRAMEFFAPSDSETERITFRESAALRGRSDELEFVMWVEDDALRTVWKGAAVSMPILELATTIHAVDDETWAEMIADQQFERPNRSGPGSSGSGHRSVPPF